jgi:hypothetical protein
MLSFCGIDVSKDRLDVMVLPDEYALAASGHVAAAPPSVAKNLRRSMWLPM